MNLVDKVKKNTILILIITIILLFIILKDDFSNIVLSIQTMDKKYIILAIFFYILSLSLKGFSNYLIINEKKKISILEAIKHNVIVQFFNGITPFATGGQPMEIYMITEHRIPALKAANQTIQSFIFYQCALVICGFLAVSYNAFFSIFPKVKILQSLVLLGFIVNIAVMAFLILISISKTTTKKITLFIVKVLKKFKIRINEKTIIQKIEDYHQGFQEIKKRKGLTIVGIGLNIASLLCLYIIPYFIAKGIPSINQLNIMASLAASAYVYILSAFVPIPGSSGGMEYGFTQFFGNFIPAKTISAVLIVWRFITYYLGIILGALLFNIEKKEIK